MGNIYKQFETDKNAEINGVKTYFGDCIFYIARAGGANKNYTAKMMKKALDTKNSKVSEINIKDFVLDVYAETILVGWENVLDENDKELPYSKENAKKILSELDDIYEEVIKIATTAANYNKAALEEVVKN